MEKLVIFDSLTGNTKMLADKIYNFYKQKGESIKIIDVKKEDEEEIIKLVNKTDIIFAGSWTDKGDCSDRMKSIYEKILNKKIFVFATCGFGGDKTYYSKLLERVKKHIDKSNQIIGSFYCQGKMPNSTKERYISLNKANPEDKNLKVSLENFENALKHPNNNDLIELERQLIKSVDIN